MSKKFITLALAGIALLSLSACSNDDDPTDTSEYSATTLVVSVPATEGNGFIDNGTSAKLFVDHYTNKANLTLTNITFNERMPRVTFALKNLRVSPSNRHVGILMGEGITPMEGYTVNDFVGPFNFNLDVLRATCSIVSTRGNMRAIIHTPLLRSTLTEKDNDTYANTTERYYNFNFTNIAERVDLEIYNIQFVEAMPKQKKLRIPLDKAGVVVTANGYTITGDNIVPYFTSGTTEVPMAERTVNNFKATLNLTASTFTVEFDCFGLHWTDSGKLL